MTHVFSFFCSCPLYPIIVSDHVCSHKRNLTSRSIKYSPPPSTLPPASASLFYFVSPCNIHYQPPSRRSTAYCLILSPFNLRRFKLFSLGFCLRALPKPCLVSHSNRISVVFCWGKTQARLRRRERAGKPQDRQTACIDGGSGCLGR